MVPLTQNCPLTGRCNFKLATDLDNIWKLQSHIAQAHCDNYRPWRCKHCPFPHCFYATIEEIRTHWIIVHPEKNEWVKFRLKIKTPNNSHGTACGAGMAMTVPLSQNGFVRWA